MGLKPKSNSLIPSLTNSSLGNQNTNSSVGNTTTNSSPGNDLTNSSPGNTMSNSSLGDIKTNSSLGGVKTNSSGGAGLVDNGQGNLPLSQEHQLHNTKDALQYLAMSKNQPNLQRNILQTNMVTPHQFMDTSKIERDKARNNRLAINSIKGPDTTASVVGATAITANSNENAANINEQVQDNNRKEGLRVADAMNQVKQQETAYKNQQIDLDNQNKVAQATVDNQNMINFSNLGFDAMTGGPAGDQQVNQKRKELYDQAKMADKQAVFAKENEGVIAKHKELNDTKATLEQNLSNLQQQYNTAIGSNNPNAAVIKQQLDQTQAQYQQVDKDLKTSQSTYDELYNRHMGTAVQQYTNSLNNTNNMLGLNLLNKKSNADAHNPNQISTPFHLRRKQGGVLPAYQKGKTLKKGLTEYASDQGLNFAANLIGSKKSERGFDMGDAITTGLSFVPGLSVVASLADNARDAYDEYKAGDLDYKDFIRYGADTATNVIPGMKAVKNAKKIGSKLGFLDKLKMFKSGGSLTVSEKKELEMYKNQLKEVAGNTKELTKLQNERLKDYIKEKKKSARMNDEKIWKILSKMIKV